MCALCGQQGRPGVVGPAKVPLHQPSRGGLGQPAALWVILWPSAWSPEGGAQKSVRPGTPHPTPWGLWVEQKDKHVLWWSGLCPACGAQVWCGKPTPQWDPCIPTLCPQTGCQMYSATCLWCQLGNDWALLMCYPSLPRVPLWAPSAQGFVPCQPQGRWPRTACSCCSVTGHPQGPVLWRWPW